MKRLKLYLSAFLFISLLTIQTCPVLAFDPPPPPPNGGNGDTPPPGGGAPVEGGMLIFVGLTMAYAVWKIRKRTNEEAIGHSSPLPSLPT